MAAEIRIPTILRPYTRDQKVVSASGSTLAAVIDDLEAQYHGIKERLVDDNGLRRFVNIYINDEDVRFSGSLNAQVADGDNITILPAVAGGSL